MYAIVQTGGKQYRVQPSDQVKVEKIPGDPGTRIDLGNVLAVGAEDGITVGSPMVEDALVKATIIRSARDRKIIVFKKKRRKGYHKKQGHRQWYTLLRIDEIIHGGSAVKAAEPAPVAEEPVVEAPAEEAKVASATEAVESPMKETAPETVEAAEEPAKEAPKKKPAAKKAAPKKKAAEEDSAEKAPKKKPATRSKPKPKTES